MSDFVADCPRCGSKKITFNLISQTFLYEKHGWQRWYEVFCVCRHCYRSTVFLLSSKGSDDSEYIEKIGLINIPNSVNGFVNIEGHITLKDIQSAVPPDFLPETILSVFKEGATCLSVNCFNAAGTMFRLCVDLATKSLLPVEVKKDGGKEAEGKIIEGLNSKVRRDLGLRLPWLFKNKLLPVELHELSTCIKEDGNDGAHEGSLKREDAEDLLDFTYALLERMYTEPERIRLANLRRVERHNKPT